MHRIRLGDLCTFQAGSAFPQMEQGGEVGVPFIKVSDLGESSDGKWLRRARNYVSDDQLARLKVRPVAAGSVIFAKIGEGLKSERLRVATTATAMDNNLMAACAKPTTSPDFLYYLLATVRLSSLAHGSALPYLRQSDLERVECAVPSLDTQRAIAEVLGALDDKIAANAALDRLLMNVLLTEFSMMQRSAVVESRFGQLAELRYGKALPASSRVPGDVVVYGSGGITGAHNEALCRAPGIVVGRKGTVGAVYWADRDFFPIDTVFYIVPKDAVSMEYLFFLLRGLPLAELNSDSAVPGLNRDEAYAQPVRVASSEEIAEFSARARCLFARASAARTESDQLANLRDTLLPHLMSGRISVRQAEKAVEEVL